MLRLGLDQGLPSAGALRLHLLVNSSSGVRRAPSGGAGRAWSADGQVGAVHHDLGLGGAGHLDWLSWLPQAGHEVWLVLGPGGGHDRFFTAPDGIQVLEAPPSRRMPPVPTALWLRRCLQGIRPDCVIGITTRPALNLLLASAGRPWPVLVAEAAITPRQTPATRLGMLRRWLYPQAALHLVQTERIGGWLTQQGLATQLALVPNAVHWPLVGQPPL